MKAYIHLRFDAFVRFATRQTFGRAKASLIAR